MDNKETYDTIIVLGGGRYNNGDLTPLSIQRLERSYQLYSKKVAEKIFAMGGYYSTYSKKAIHFKISGAQLRREFLINLGVKSDDIIMVENGRDTIGEAFASRKSANELQMKKVLIVTSDKHMKRALWAFRRIFGKGFEINGESVPCGNLLIEDEEKRYYDATVTYFQKFPENIPDPIIEVWFEENKELYSKFKAIHDKYHLLEGQKSQAYSGVRK